MSRIVTLFGKTHAWVRAPQTGQWRLVRIPESEHEVSGRVWDSPEYDVISDIRRSLERPK